MVAKVISCPWSGCGDLGPSEKQHEPGIHTVTSSTLNARDSLKIAVLGNYNPINEETSHLLYIMYQFTALIC